MVVGERQGGISVGGHQSCVVVLGMGWEKENFFSVISGNVVSGKCYLEEKREELFYKGRKYIK